MPGQQPEDLSRPAALLAGPPMNGSSLAVLIGRSISPHAGRPVNAALTFPLLVERRKPPRPVPRAPSASDGTEAASDGPRLAKRHDGRLALMVDPASLAALGLSVSKLLLRWADLSDVADAADDASQGISALRRLRANGNSQDHLAAAITRRLRAELPKARSQEDIHELNIVIMNVSALFDKVAEDNQMILTAARDPEEFTRRLLAGKGRRLLSQTEEAYTPATERMIQAAAELFSEIAPTSPRYVPLALTEMLSGLDDLTAMVASLGDSLETHVGSIKGALRQVTEDVRTVDRQDVHGGRSLNLQHGEQLQASRQLTWPAPETLSDRDAETTLLRDAISNGVPALWFVGPSFCGKTALLAWNAVNPPPDCIVVACFIRSTGQRNTTDYLLRTLFRQLSLWASNVDASPDTSGEIVDMLRPLVLEAAKVAGEDSKRLVIVVDGLDEALDRTALSQYLDGICGDELDNVTLVLSSRADVPVDLSEIGWLTERIINLNPCAAALAAEAAVRVEVEQASTSARGTGRRMLGVLAAHPAGLDPKDLALLFPSGSVEERLDWSDLMATHLGRTVIQSWEGDGPVFRLAHDSILTHVRLHLQDEVSWALTRTMSLVAAGRESRWDSGVPRFLRHQILDDLCTLALLQGSPFIAPHEALQVMVQLLLDPAWITALDEGLEGGASPDSLVLTYQEWVRKAVTAGAISDVESLTFLALCGSTVLGGSRAQASVLSALARTQADLGNIRAAVRLADSIYNVRLRDGVLIEVTQCAARADDARLVSFVCGRILGRGPRAVALARAIRSLVVGGDRTSTAILLEQLSHELQEVRSQDTKDDVVARLLYPLISLEQENAALNLWGDIASLTGRAFALRDVFSNNGITDPGWTAAAVALSAEVKRAGADHRALRAGGVLLPALASCAPESIREFTQFLIQQCNAVQGSADRSSALADIANGLGRVGNIEEARKAITLIPGGLAKATAAARLAQRLSDGDATARVWVWQTVEEVAHGFGPANVSRLWGRLAFSAWFAGDEATGDRAFDLAMDAAARVRSKIRAHAFSELTRFASRAGREDEAARAAAAYEGSRSVSPHLDQALRSEALFIVKNEEVRAACPRGLRHILRDADSVTNRGQRDLLFAQLATAAMNMGEVTLAVEAHDQVWNKASRAALGARLISFGEPSSAMPREFVLRTLEGLDQLAAGIPRVADRVGHVQLSAAEGLLLLGQQEAYKRIHRHFVESLCRLEWLNGPACLIARRILMEPPLGEADRENLIVHLQRLLGTSSLDPYSELELLSAMSRVSSGGAVKWREDVRARLSQLDGLRFVLAATPWLGVTRSRGEVGVDGLLQQVLEASATLRGRARAQANLALLASLGTEVEAALSLRWWDAAVDGACSSRDPYARALWSAKIVVMESAPEEVVRRALNCLLLSGYMRLHLEALPSWLAAELVAVPEYFLRRVAGESRDGRRAQPPATGG